MAAPVGHKAYNVNGEGGRPVIYDDEFLEAEGKALLEWMNKPGNFWLNKFAIVRGYQRQMFDDWAKKSKVFARDLSHAKEIQEAKLVEAGLLGEHQYKMSMFVLSNIEKERWRMRTETEVTGTQALNVNVMAFGVTQQPEGELVIEVKPEPVKEITCHPSTEQ